MDFSVEEALVKKKKSKEVRLAGENRKESIIEDI